MTGRRRGGGRVTAPVLRRPVLLRPVLRRPVLLRPVLLRPVLLAGTVAGALVLAVVVLSPVSGLPTGVGAALAAAVLVVATAGVVRGVPDLAAGLVLVAVGTATWNGFELAGLQIAHGTLAAAVVLLGAHAVATRARIALPAWVLVLGAVIVVVASTQLLAPTGDAYLASRAAVTGPARFADAVAATDPQTDGLLSALRWLVAAVGLPLAAVLAVASRPSLAARAASWWAAGAAVGGLVAVTDSLGLTAVSAQLLGTVDVGGRQAGLSVQPNHLALGVALTVPVVVWRLLRAGPAPVRVGWWAVLAADAGGLVVSGSRGGLVAAVGGGVAVLLVDRGGRRALVPTAAAVTALLALVVAARPSLLTGLAERLRFSDDAPGAAASDRERAGLAQQAVADFLHAPVRGVGLQVVTQGHDIYLQLLAAGGVLLLVGFVVGMAGALVDAVVLPDRRDGLVPVLVVSLLVWLVVGLVENQLTDVFLYVPFALVAALRALRRGAGPAEFPAEFPAAGPAGAPAPAAVPVPVPVAAAAGPTPSVPGVLR